MSILSGFSKKTSLHAEAARSDVSDNLDFRDVPEAITQGNSLEEGLAYAAEALELALKFYRDEHRPAPTPTAKRNGEYLVAPGNGEKETDGKA